ncbi:3-phosphoshikimate 1-carboxyvinyltransferase [Blochmannia endosymbiont of Camponotus sp. C-003]|uniref:3-phosphoshikimate 1-carboxyvinyltransferase n=1 Tax=unclassified Candidatus Blochmanniella TaxID=711328 RepID=UPI002024D3FD|nr:MULTISPECIES: 3-phosphoshikimate 1-carboxyvinyltransferase [unclassified Candidatus Blochmannia]URJ23437.1 3-phosphoshikimate 1-carboxyvinyltransferase [Blochmannia endosymbiont of Camponotus sp. C-003]URJ28909.1 3-phosphoshikimate 1-carboxyvinyltransferase [Blochmannia endosymbiont of Camponotus sp. C-046]
MNNFIKLDPIRKVHGTIHLPGSKSISNRALLLAAQSIGTTQLTNLLNSDDVHCMLDALRDLGVSYCLSNDRTTCEINGVGGLIQSRNNGKLILYLRNAGTVMRPLIAALSVKNQNIVLTGYPRMKNRPIEHLVNALRQGGAHIEYMERNGYPPIRLHGGYCGGEIFIKGSISSQFLSSMLMMAPLASRDTLIKVDGVLVSRPYIDMTLSLMKIFGIDIQHENYRVFYCKGNAAYQSPGHYLVEGDASSASYFLAASAIRGGTVRVIGVGRNSKQGDIYFANILERMGAKIKWSDNYIECSRGSDLSAVDLDVNDIPDAAMTLAIVALFSINGPTVLRNIYNWRIKESDRIAAMATELRKIGAEVVEGYDYLQIIPPVKIKSAYIDTYDDHRIAMCFSLTALSDVSMIINNPKCIDKTFPDFFTQLSSISVYD